MSAAHHGHDSHERATEEASVGVNIRKILLIGVSSIVIFAISIVAAAKLLGYEERRLVDERGGPRPNPILGQAEVNMVDFVDFDADTRVDEFKRRTQAALASYGWADKAKGLVRIPIADAMKKVVTEQQAGQPRLQPLPWRTAPTAPGTLDEVIRNLVPAPAAPADPPAAPAPATPGETQPQ